MCIQKLEEQERDFRQGCGAQAGYKERHIFSESLNREGEQFVREHVPRIGLDGASSVPWQARRLLLWGYVIQIPDASGAGFFMACLRQSVAEGWTAEIMLDFFEERHLLERLPSLHGSWWQ